MRKFAHILILAAALAAPAAVRERAAALGLRAGYSRVEIDIADDGTGRAPWVESAVSLHGPWCVPEQEAALSGGIWTVTVRRPGASGFFRAWRGEKSGQSAVAVGSGT